MTTARKTEIKIVYKDKDISKDIAPYLLSFTYNDNISGVADDITFKLEDRDELWANDWLPAKGDKVQCSIILHDDKNMQTRPCGTYEIDEITYTSPPRVITLKGISGAISKNMRNEKHSRAWENITLKTIASDIANENDLELFFDGDDVNYERKEQNQESDMKFLESLCVDAGLNLKINENKIIIFSGENYEEKESVTSFDIDDDKLISFSFKGKAANIYRKAHVKYHDSVKDELYEAEEEDADAEGTERVLEIRERVESISAAKELAKQRLYEHNKKEITGQITLMGDIRFYAGQNITLENFGAFSGKYWLNKATHTVSNGYTTVLDIGMTQASKKEKKKGKKKDKKGAVKELFYEGNNYYRS